MSLECQDEAPQQQRSSTTKKRKMSSVVTGYDYDELRKNYTFLPEEDRPPQSWQERMVLQYHQHLYKDYVLADTTRVHSHKQVGLRWRTEKEVRRGRGSSSCGNLQCPAGKQPPKFLKKSSEEEELEEAPQSTVSLYLSSEDPSRESQEVDLLSALSHGSLLSDYEVPFTYKEQGLEKTELVKLCLCARCAPLLFVSRGDKTPSLTARRKRRVDVHLKNQTESDRLVDTQDSQHQVERASIPDEDSARNPTKTKYDKSTH